MWYYHPISLTPHSQSSKIKLYKIQTFRTFPRNPCNKFKFTAKTSIIKKYTKKNHKSKKKKVFLIKSDPKSGRKTTLIESLSQSVQSFIQFVPRHESSTLQMNAYNPNSKNRESIVSQPQPPNQTDKKTLIKNNKSIFYLFE